MVRAVTDDSFEADVLRSAKAVIVEYWAQWCGPCRQLSPVPEAIAAEHADAIDVVKVNADENPRTTARYRVMLVPTVAVFCAGEVVRRLVGPGPGRRCCARSPTSSNGGRRRPVLLVRLVRMLANGHDHRRVLLCPHAS
jgi:thioredoxin 1